LTVSGAALLLAEYYTHKQASLRYAMFFTFGLLGPCFSGLLAYGIREMDGIQGRDGKSPTDYSFAFVTPPKP